MAHVTFNLRTVANQKHLTKNRSPKKTTRYLSPVYPAHANEVWYRQQLMYLVSDIDKEVRKNVTPLAVDYSAQITAADGMARDASKKAVMDAISKTQKKYDTKKMEALAEKTAKTLVQKNLKTVDDRLTSAIKKSTGVDLKGAFVTTPGLRKEMTKAAEENVALITDIPDEYFLKLRKRVTKAFETGMRPETTAKYIQELTGVTESRARLIARDQTAKMNSAFNQERQESVGIEKYEWQTSGDERVRESHSEKDGKVFRWDDPPSDTGHPGEDIQCRCVAIPIF